MTHPDRSTPLRPRRRAGVQSGFSLIEVMIASLIFLTIVLGLVPLFHRAMLYNASGREATAITNGTTSEMEVYYQFPLDNRELDVAASGGDEIRTTEHWNPIARLWQDDEPAVSIPQRERTTVIRQYSLNALADGELDPTERLDGAANPREVHFKEVEVLLVSAAGDGVAGVGGRTRMRHLKAY